MEKKKSTVVLRRNDIDNEFLKLKKENDLLKIAVDTSYENIGKKTEELKIIYEKFENVQNLNNDYYNANISLAEELTTTKETVDLLKVQLSHLQRDNGKFSREIENFGLVQEKLQFMEQEHRQSLTTESKLRSELLTLRSQHDDTVDAMNILELDCQKYKQLSEDYTVSLEKKSNEVEVYYGVITKLESVLDDTKNNNSSLKELLQHKEEELSAVTSELNESKEILHMHENMNNDLLAAKNQLDKQLKDMTNELDNLNNKFQSQLDTMKQSNAYSQNIENKLLVTMNELDEKDKKLKNILEDYELLENNYKKVLENLKDSDFVSMRYETLKEEISRERIDLNAEIENLQSCVVTLNKALAEKDDYIYSEEDVHREQLARNHDVIEKLLKENKNLISKESEVVNLTQLLDETNAMLLAKTKLFEESVTTFENKLCNAEEQYKKENLKVEALIIQVKEDYEIIKRLQNGLDVIVEPLNSYATEEKEKEKELKEPIKPQITHGRLRKRVYAKEPVVSEKQIIAPVVPVVEKRNPIFIENILKKTFCETETSTDLSNANIELLFETEQSHITLNSQYSELQATHEKLKQTAERLSKSNIEFMAKIEKLSKDNKNVLERYDIKVAELTDIIDQDENEINRLNKEHNGVVKRYENQIEELKDSIQSYEKTVNELNVFKDEQDSIYASLNETIKNQKLELLSMKNQNILQKTHETNIMDSYNEQLSRNDELSKENKSLKLSVYDHEHSIELLKSKLEAISKHNTDLAENETEQARIVKEQYSTITILRNEKEEFENKFNNLESQISEDYLLVEEHKKVISRYKEELKNLVDENTEYGISESAYKETTKQYEDEIEQLSIALNNSKTAYSLLQQRLQEIQRKETEYKALLKKMENEAEHAKYEVVTLRDELTSKTRIMDDMMGDKESLQDIMIRLENSKKENTRLQEELENVENEKENAIADCESQKAALSDLYSLCDEQRDNITSLKDSLKTSNDSLTSLTSRIEELLSEKNSSEQQHTNYMNELKNKFVLERASMKDLERDLNEVIEEKETKIRTIEKELLGLKEVFENNRNMLEKYQKNHEEIKKQQENNGEIIEDYKTKIEALELQLSEQATMEQQLHEEIDMLEKEKKSFGVKLADAINKEREKSEQSMVTIKEDSEEIKKLQKKVEVQSSLIQKLRDSEKALRENDNLMQDDIKTIMSEKESLRDEVSKLKQLNTSVLTRIKKHNEEKQELEQSCETLKNTIIEYVETIKKMSKNEYDHAYLRNQIHHQEKNFAAFI